LAGAAPARPAVELKGPVEGRAAEVLTPEALAFLAELHRRFNDRRLELLALREERQTRFDAGARPDFLAETRAVRDGDYFVINGAKVFNSQVNLADRTVLVTRTDPDVPQHKGISLFFVDPKSPGVTIERLETLAFRSVGTNRVTYDNVRVHKDDLLGELNGGWKHLMTNLNKERFSLAAQVTGAAQAALDCALQYAKDRVQFGQPIAKFQVIQHKLADMQIAVHTSRALTYDLARRLDAGVECRTEASIAKVFTTEAYFRVADEGMQILGGYSMTPDFQMERHYRDSRVMRIGGGSNEVMRNSIAKDLGL